MLEWEEHTFLGIKALYERLVTRPQERAAAEVRVHLDPHRQRLFLLAQMAAKGGVTLFETEENALCDDRRIFLPPSFDLARTREANLAFLEIKTLLAGLAIRNAWPDDTVLVERLPEVGETFPRLPEMISLTIEAFPESAPFWEALGTVYQRDLKGSEQTGQMGEEGESAELAEAEITEIRGRGQLDVAVEEAQEDDGDGFETPIHTFEKAETLEESSGLSRRKDAADELRDHEEALRQLDMTHVLRSRERPASIYRADVLLDAVAFETAGSCNRGIPYPEWDFRKRRYRDGWCRVQESEVEIADMAWITDVLARRRGLIQTLKKSLAAAANERLRTRRQPAGPEFDLDAVVEGQVARRAGCAPSENIYQEKRRALYDIAALLLLDRSYSTEGYLGGRRVLDLIRETIACVGEVLDEFLDQFAIAAFSSDTRHHCAFDWVKPFGAPWSGTRARLGGIRAAGYTRIGPALRHAQEVLMPVSAARKVVILITDGRPCDYDRYEGIYGIQDVKRAISTGKDHGIDTHAFAIETRARETFPTMFSRQHFHIIPKPEALTASLCELFSRLRTG